MKRKLATIAVVNDIRPIEGADNIEQCKIRGWNVVVKKNEFKEGDLAIYCEIDSLMPERSEFEFLAPRKYRIKTTRLKGTISQGIAFPLSILPGNIEIVNGIKRLTYNRETVNLSPGADVTELLGVEKYEEPIPANLSGEAKGGFPSHSIKTDEERIQNLIDNFEEYRCFYTWTATEKLDGSSVTFSIYDDVFEVCSRNRNLKEHPENEQSTFWKVARDLDIEGKMREFMKKNDMKALTLQGELIGEGIQKNKYKRKGQTVKFFRIFDPIEYKFFDHINFIHAIMDMGLNNVPVIETDMTLPETIEELIAMADGKSSLADTPREGIVFVAESVLPGTYLEGPLKGMSARPLKDYQGRLSFKVISNKFILKHDQ